MSQFTTALGETYAVERRLPPLAWEPSVPDGDFSNAVDILPDVGDDIGVLAIVGLFLLAILLIAVIAPLLWFVAEIAIVFVIVIPLSLLGIAVGVIKHSVVLRAGGKDGPVVEQREVRGPVASFRARRALEQAAEAGEFRQQAAEAIAAAVREAEAAERAERKAREAQHAAADKAARSERSRQRRKRKKR